MFRHKNRHARRIRIDNTGLEQDLFADVKNLQEALELTENLTAWAEIEDTTTSFSSGETKEITFAWTDVDSDFFDDDNKGTRLRAGWVWLTGPNEMGNPPGGSQREGAFLTLRPQESGSTNMKVCSMSGTEAGVSTYTGAHFDDVRDDDVLSFAVFDSNNRIYLSNAYIDGANGVVLEFTNRTTTTTTINVMGTAIAVS